MSHSSNSDSTAAVIDAAIALNHPLQSGDVFYSRGGHFGYRVIGPCCRLFDREELPWPCCRLQWRSKEPSWRRIGKRLVLDSATRQAPSYSVEFMGQEAKEPLIITLYWLKLPQPLRDWWYSTGKDSPRAIAPPQR